MSKGLIERLRARADMHVAATPATMLREAAARIRELEAELETCRKYRDAYRQCDEIATADVRRLEAENAALREGRGAKPLPRREGVGDWTLRMDLLSDLNREVQSKGWDGCTAEVTEIIALSVERRILSALSPAPVSVGDNPEDHCAKCGAPRSNHPYRHLFVPRALSETSYTPSRPRSVVVPNTSPTPHHTWVAYSPERPGIGWHYADTEEEAMEKARAALSETEGE